MEKFHWEEPLPETTHLQKTWVCLQGISPHPSNGWRRSQVQRARWKLLQDCSFGKQFSKPSSKVPNANRVRPVGEESRQLRPCVRTQQPLLLRARHPPLKGTDRKQSSLDQVELNFLLPAAVRPRPRHRAAMLKEVVSENETSLALREPLDPHSAFQEFLAEYRDCHGRCRTLPSLLSSSGREAVNFVPNGGRWSEANLNILRLAYVRMPPTVRSCRRQKAVSGSCSD